MKLCCELVETDRIKDVFTDENYPQFNVGRATKELREQLLPAAEGVDTSALSEADRDELEQAVNDANAMLSRTVAVEGEAPAVEQRLRSILEKVGAVEKQSNALDSVSPVVKTISDFLLSVGGAKGYSEIPMDLISKITGGNGGENPTDENPTEAPADNPVPTTAPSTAPASAIPAGTDANNPKTTGRAETGVFVSVAAFAAFTALSVVKLKKKKEE